MVKLTRTLAIIPAVLVFSAVNLHIKRKQESGTAGAKVKIAKIFPWFILGFLAMSGLTSLGLIPAGFAAFLKNASKFLMVAALAAIGLNTDFKALCRSKADASRIYRVAPGGAGRDRGGIRNRRGAAWNALKIYTSG